MLVPSRDLVAYVQLLPVKHDPHPAQIAGLIAKTGPFTPDLPCVIAVASLGPKAGVGVRCTSIEVNMASKGANRLQDLLLPSSGIPFAVIDKSLPRRSCGGTRVGAILNQC